MTDSGVISLDKNQFLDDHEKYQLGHLITEKPHPLTQGLSDFCQKDLTHALDLMKQVDQAALKEFRLNAHLLSDLQKSIQKTLIDGHRIFLCGCGATGRLSLLLESLWHEIKKTNQVTAFMAGGDVAMVHSLEGFEDFPEYGAKHLTQLGFKQGDLLIASSEGGETPYVIGATQAAAEISTNTPFFIFCNPSDLLVETIDRSKNLIKNNKINKISLCVGPMALAGSTRLQASTVLQLAIGFALFETQDPAEFVDEFITLTKDLNYQPLKELIEKECEIYQQNSFVMYAPRVLATTVFTDTTERAPTFSLPYFEDRRGLPLSWCYVLIPEAETSKQAWDKLLGRSPKALEWPQIDSRTTSQYLQGFDFSRNILDIRQEKLGLKRQHIYHIDSLRQQFLFSLSGVEVALDFKTDHPLYLHTALKMLLNAQSTLMMGRMKRFESNIMTWVRPSNGKLIDRAARYISALLKEKSITPSYGEIIDCLFSELETLQPHQSIVMKVVSRMEKKQ